MWTSQLCAYWGEPSPCFPRTGTQITNVWDLVQFALLPRTFEQIRTFHTLYNAAANAVREHGCALVDEMCKMQFKVVPYKDSSHPDVYFVLTADPEPPWARVAVLSLRGIRNIFGSDGLAINQSGCRHWQHLLTALCFDQTRQTIPGELFTLILGVVDSCTTALNDPEFQANPSYLSSSNPPPDHENDKENEEKVHMYIRPRTVLEVLEEKRKDDRAALYLILMGRCPRARVLNTAQNDQGISTRDEFIRDYEQTSAQPCGSDHTLILGRFGDQSVIVQAYARHYTYAQWLQFDAPLQQSLLIPKINRGTLHRVVPRPSYRGVLSWKQTRDFARDMDALTQSGDHIHRYARITGIHHSRRTIGQSFRLAFARMELRSQ